MILIILNVTYTRILIFIDYFSSSITIKMMSILNLPFTDIRLSVIFTVHIAAILKYWWHTLSLNNYDNLTKGCHFFANDNGAIVFTILKFPWCIYDPSFSLTLLEWIFSFYIESSSECEFDSLSCSAWLQDYGSYLSKCHWLTFNKLSMFIKLYYIINMFSI